MADIRAVGPEDVDMSVYDSVTDTNNKTGGVFDVLADARKSAAMLDRQAMELARIRVANKQSNLLDEWNIAKDEVFGGADVEQLKQAEKYTYSRKAQQELGQFVREGVTSTDPAIQAKMTDIIAGSQQMVEDQLASLQDVDGTEKMLSDMYASDTTTDYTRRVNATKQFMNTTLANWLEQQGTASYIGHFISAAFAPDIFKDTGDFVDRGEFSAVNDFIEFAQEFKALTPDEQVVAFQDVFPRIVDAFDNNPYDVQTAVATLTDPDGTNQIALEMAFDLAGLASLPGDVVAASKLARWAGKKAIPTKPSTIAVANTTAKNNSVPHQMNAVNGQDAAAEAATVAGLDPTMSSPLGMTKLDSVSTANPLRIEELPLFNSSVDNLADKMAEIHRSSLERDIAKATEELQDLRTQTTAGQRRQHETAIVEIPRKIEALEDNIKKLNKALKSGAGAKKGTSKSSRMAESRKIVFEKQILANAKEIKGLREVLVKAETAVQRRARVEEINAELMKLRAGYVPNRLAEAITQATRQIQQSDVVALGRRKLISEQRADQAKALTKHADEGVVKAFLEGETASVAGRVLNNPELYGISQEFAQDLANTVSLPVKAISAEAEELTLKAITDADRAVTQSKVVDKIIREAESAKDPIRVAEISEMDDAGGFTLTYYRNGVENNLTYRYGLNDIGVYEGIGTIGQSLKAFAKNLLSPETLFKSIDRFVDDLTFGGDQAAKIANRMQKIHRDIHKPLSSAQRQDLDSLLIAGDEVGRVFTYEEMKAGLIETAHGIKGHDDEVIGAYYKMRTFYDELHDVRDFFLRKELQFSGYKDVAYTSRDGEVRHFIARPREDFRGLDLSEESTTSIWVPNGIANDERGYTNLAAVHREIKTWQEEGYQIVEMLEPHQFPNNKNTVRLALVSPDDTVKLRDLPSKVLNYKQGYIPRVYKPGYHFVKDYSNPQTPYTLFATETRADAEKFAAEIQRFDSSFKLQVKGDREITRAEQQIIDAESLGGLYTGKRKSTSLMLRHEDGSVRPDRMTTGEATARYMANMANIMPMSEYRMGMMKRWANTVDELAREENRAGLVDKLDFFGEIDLSPDKKLMMEATRDYLKSQLHMSTYEEKLFANQLQKFSDVLYNKDASKARQFTRDIIRGAIEKDPVQQLKGLTFNLQLGMFNVRQWLVQIQNASIAASVSPQHALPALADALAMRTVIFASDKDLPAVVKAASALVGKSESELMELVTTYKKTGLLDSIKRNADFDANVLSKGQESFANLRKFAQAGRVFFTEGETMSRLMSFNIARRNLGPNASVQELFDEHLRLSMNMQAANQASWQKNAFGVPTQYMQVFAKFYERLGAGLIYGRKGNGKWSRREAAQVLAGQFLLYGTVGVPFAEDAYAWIAQQTGKTPEQLEQENPLLRETIEEGLTGMVSEILGFDNNFAKDLSIASGTAESLGPKFIGSMIDGLINGGSELDAYRLLLGPTGAIANRTTDLISSMVMATKVLVNDPTLDNLGDQVYNVLDDFAALSSTWSSARKAVFLHDVGIQSRTGNTLIGADRFADTNLQTLLARAMNFETDIEKDYWSLKEYNRDSQKAQKEDLSVLKKAYLQAMRTGNFSQYNVVQALVLTGKTPQERQRLRESIIKGATGDSDFDRQARYATQHFILSGGKLPLQPGTSK